MSTDYNVLIKRLFQGNAADINKTFISQKRAFMGIYKPDPRVSVGDKRKEINIITLV